MNYSYLSNLIRFSKTTKVAFVVALMAIVSFGGIFVHLASAQSSQGSVEVLLQGTATTAGTTAGEYNENIALIPAIPLPTDLTADLDVFAASDTTTPLKGESVTIPAGTGATSQLIEGLTPGSYAMAVYSGPTRISALGYFLIVSTNLSTASAATPPLIVQATGTTASATAGQFNENIQVIPTVPLSAALTVDLDVFAASDTTTPLKHASVPLPAGAGATSQLVEGLVPGSYAAAIYNGSTRMSALAYFLVSTYVPSLYPLNLQTVSQSASTTPGQYQEKFNITPLTPLTAVTSVNLKIFKSTNTNTALSSTAVSLPVGAAPTAQTIDKLAPGAYAAALYVGTVKKSPTLFFSIGDNSAGVDVVSISYPPASQVIGKTSATIVGNVKVQIAIPVKLSYVWGKVGSPMGNETSLLNVAMMQPSASGGAGTQITLNFTNLTVATSYQFAVKNLVLNTISQPLQFTTLNANGTSPSSSSNPLLYGGALFPYQPNAALGGTVTAQAVVFQDNTPATGIVPACGRTAGSGVLPSQTNMCGYNDFLQLISNVLHYAIVILGPIIACIVLYAGAMIIWLSSQGGDPTAKAKADMKRYGWMLVRVAVGIAIILLAWVIVATILRELGVKANYSFLDLLS